MRTIDMKNDDICEMIPETLTWCRRHYVSPVKKYITCDDFGNAESMNGGCWWCMEMTPYQWHMCQDETWVKNLLGDFSKLPEKTRANAIEFIEDYKQCNPMDNERRWILSERDR